MDSDLAGRAREQVQNIEALPGTYLGLVSESSAAVAGLELLERARRVAADELVAAKLRSIRARDRRRRRIAAWRAASRNRIEKDLRRNYLERLELEVAQLQRASAVSVTAAALKLLRRLLRGYFELRPVTASLVALKEVISRSLATPATLFISPGECTAIQSEALELFTSLNIELRADKRLAPGKAVLLNSSGRCEIDWEQDLASIEAAAIKRSL